MYQHPALHCFKHEEKQQTFERVSNTDIRDKEKLKKDRVLQQETQCRETAAPLQRKQQGMLGHRGKGLGIKTKSITIHMRGEG